MWHRIIAVCLVLAALCAPATVGAQSIDVDQDSNDAVDIGYGGTNAATAADARTNLGISATNTPFTPAGDVEATDTQAAIEEVSAEKEAAGTAAAAISSHESTYSHGNYNTAYSHSQTTSGNPHSVTASDVGAIPTSGSSSPTTAIDLSGGSLELPNGTSLPGSCNAGQVFIDTDATSGQQVYVCESGGWVLQGDGGGGGAGDIEAVLDDATGAVPILHQAFAAITSTDATPDVSAGQNFRTANASATTITDFDGTMLEDGRDLWLFINDANTTIDLTSSGIEAGNRSTDYAVDNGMLLHFKYSTTDNQWHALNIPDEVATVATDGFMRNDSGTVTTDDYGTSAGTVAEGNHTHTGVYEPADATILKQADVDDTPVNSATTDPVSSNWAYGHENAADPHTQYLRESLVPVVLGVACSDESTDLTTGTAKVTFRMPYAMSVSEVRANVSTAPAGSTLNVDINEGGTSILSTVITIDATEETSETAATAAVISDSALADDAEMTVDIDQIGSSTAGTGLKIWIIGTRSL